MASDSNITAPPPAGDAAGSSRFKIYAGADGFGCSLKDAVVAHLRSVPGIDVVDLGIDKYYSIGARVGSLASSATDASPETRGLLCCGTGVGVGIFANKFPGVYAATCASPDDAANARSISACNVLALSGTRTSPADAEAVVDAWIATPFKAPCPASGGVPWPEDIQTFLDAAPAEMTAIPPNPSSLPADQPTCAICYLRKGLDFEPVSIMPGGEMKIVRESPTSAIVRFKAGSVEPAHHHTFGHDLIVMKGKKKVWNLTKKESYWLEDGDFLFTPAGDVHRVKYIDDTEFFIRWDGDWDIFLDEDLDTAKVVIEKELAGGGN